LEKPLRDSSRVSENRSAIGGSGYTRGMKTAVSIPDDVFEKAERLAHRMKSRSELFSRALAEYVARHAPDHVTEAMNQACAEIGIEPDLFSSAAARATLERVEW
jgi:metal-responsive CopG/Arc/MetJ family transcriptional regulator